MFLGMKQNPDFISLLQAQSLTRVHHRNLVSLIGYCKDRDSLALVYEYMSQGTLRDHLQGLELLIFATI